ncbi:ABC transporter substrate-binding protein [Acuticoccus mangrovi]|uniref:ABC transporter substrate-binding protein n=1 Tax=Acuticoccus mangrovi TaxID=2796142 RepID=A0A934IMV4_9HYPH|nr:ABC transporter substrate-binding protein [Acuticoccus mangrovi]MBJ3775356.1 ABC transporter substrate-binding protein [Acuticoccus mangrovi]
MALRNNALLAGAIFVTAAGLVGPAVADDALCDLNRPVVFGGLDYGSAAFHTAVARLVLEEGYGCETEAIPGTTLILNQGLGRGDVDVIMEVWTANTAQTFLDAEAAGKAERLGTTFPDAKEGWYVPRYLVEGEGAEAPGLKSAEDLADYKALFKDPEEPELGRFLNCVIGWQCEVVNTKKLHAYGLDDDYTNVRAGSGAALEAAVESAYLRKRPVVFYHWEPTWLLGKYDFVKLDEPPFDQATWDKMMAEEDPDVATAYPTTKVVIGGNVAFGKDAPKLREFLLKYGTTTAVTGAALAYMRDNDASPEEAARVFLAEDKIDWRPWMPEAAADRLAEALTQ